MSEILPTINGIDAALFLLVIVVGVCWLYDRDRWRTKLRAANESADRWAERTVDAQCEVERLRGSIAAEVEARLDAEVEARLEAAERMQSAHDRIEVIAAAVWRRLHAAGLGESVSRGDVPWEADAVTMLGVQAVDVEEEETR